MKKNLLKLVFSLIFFILIPIGAKAQPPVANFTYSLGLNGLVTFSSTSTGTNPATYYGWYFNDILSGNYNSAGGTALTYTDHVFGSNGTYSVYLQVSQMTGSAAIQQVITVTNSPCNLPIDANWYITNIGGATYSFTSISTGTTVGVTYAWDFGDGNTSALANPFNTYTANGNYNVNLKIVDGGCKDSLANILTVTGVCTLVPNFTYSIGLSGQITFTDTSVGTSTNTYFSWWFGDPLSGPLDNASGTLTAHLYGSNGTYVVSHAVTTPGTCSTIATQTLTITNSPCNLPINANWTLSPGNGNSTNFISLCTGTTGTASYTWNFGDGNSAFIPNPAHTYSASGNYSVELKVVDGLCKDSLMNLVPITICSITASYNFTAGLNGYNAFSSTSTGTTINSTYSWDYGDGNWDNGSIVTHTYNANSSYTVWLYVSTPSVCTSSYSNVITVNNTTCNLVTAGFTYSDVGGGTLNFVSTSTGTSGTSTYTWNYGDGNIGNGPVSAHTYSNGGWYYGGYFIASNGPGCKDSISMMLNVTSIPCLANTNFTLAYSGTPLLWYIIPAYPWNIGSAVWNWGDGNIDCCSMFTSHTYSAAGLYNICLTATTCAGTSSTCGGYNVFKPAKDSELQAMVTVSVVPFMPMVAGFKNNVEENATINIYPNPTDGKLNLKISDIHLETKNALVEVYNVLGNKVYERNFEPVNGSIDTTLNLEQLNNGLYSIKIKTKDRNYLLKTIVNK